MSCRTHRARRLAGPALFVAALVAGCATPAPPAPGPDTSPSAEIRDVPFHPQKKYQCGPAALATAIGDLGIAADPDDLVSEVYVPQRQGSLPAEMRAAARRRGLVAYPLSPSIDDLISAIDAGYPVLVMQNLGLDWLPRWHYAVAVGYDLEEGTIVLRSETRRRHVTDVSTFQRTWRRSGHWAQIVVEPRDVPATAQPLPWIEAVHELEQRGRLQAALSGYRSATESWPGFRAGWMARGNTAWEAGHPEEAQEAFARAVELEPAAWDGWNNLAHVLAGNGCGTQAARAAACAADLAPAKDAARDTFERFAGAGGSHQCRALPPCPATSRETSSRSD